MFATGHLAQRVRPITASRTRLLPVPAPIAPLLPGGGLRRGTAVRCAGDGAFSLALALAGGPSAAGSWCAVVGTSARDLGAGAAEGFGIDLRRLVVVRVVPAEWALAAGTLLDGIDVVVVAPPPHAKPSLTRTLTARARDRGAVLLVLEDRPSWPVDLELAVVDPRWHGLAEGAGRLQARRVTVVARGRGSAVRPVRRDLWLPTATGGVAAA